MDERIIKILVDRIKSGKINPVTGEPFKVEDIKLAEYKAEVETRLSQQG